MPQPGQRDGVKNIGKREDLNFIIIIIMKYLIIGNGAAGMTAAKTLREKSTDASITVITDEKYHYYNRPALIDFIAGNKKNETELYFYPENWYSSNKIEVLLEKTAGKINLSEKKVYLDDGTSLNYDKLLIAAGARSNLPPIPRDDTADSALLTLRCLEDAKDIIVRASTASKITVIGGGVLGLEAGCALKTRFPDVEISILEVAPWLLPRQLDANGAAILESQLKKLGIGRIETGVKIISVGKTPNGIKINIEKPDKKLEITADFALVSAGIKPNIELAAESGISVGKAIIVNEFLETSAQDIFAAGDIAEFNKTLWGIIPAAIEQGRIAASNILAPGSISYKGTITSNTLKVAGLELTTEGNISTSPEISEVSFSDGEKGIYKKIFIKKENNIPAGFICLGDKNTARKLSAILKKYTPLPPEEAKKIIS